MLTEFGQKMQIVGLKSLKIAIYIIGAPFMVVFMLYGMWFVIALFLWVLLVGVAEVCAIIAFVASFYTGIVALFIPSLWSTIGSWWTWIWGWFSSGNIALWPHFAKSFLPYILSGMVLMALFKSVEWITTKIASIKSSPYIV